MHGGHVGTNKTISAYLQHKGSFSPFVFMLSFEFRDAFEQAPAHHMTAADAREKPLREAGPIVL